jgi:hypothetical protein
LIAVGEIRIWFKYYAYSSTSTLLTAAWGKLFLNHSLVQRLGLALCGRARLVPFYGNLVGKTSLFIVAGASRLSSSSVLATLLIRRGEDDFRREIRIVR